MAPMISPPFFTQKDDTSAKIDLKEELVQEETEVEEEPLPEEPTAPLLKKKSQGISSIRVDINRLDHLMTLAGELVLVRNEHLQVLDKVDPVIRSMTQRLDLVTSELQEEIMMTRMQPVGNLFNKLPRLVRDISATFGKQIDLQISGKDVEMDKSILESLSDPVTHIVRNCYDHGIEIPEVRETKGKPREGTISITACHEGGQINITIADNGAGFNLDAIKTKAVEKGFYSKEDAEKLSEKEILHLALRPDFSTAKKVSEISGRGVGMDVVKTGIERLGGNLDLKSDPDSGTTITLRLPLTLAIIPCLIVKVGGDRFAIPQINLEELVCMTKT